MCGENGDCVTPRYEVGYAFLTIRSFCFLKHRDPEAQRKTRSHWSSPGCCFLVSAFLFASVVSLCYFRPQHIGRSPVILMKDRSKFAYVGGPAAAAAFVAVTLRFHEPAAPLLCRLVHLGYLKSTEARVRKRRSWAAHDHAGQTGVSKASRAPRSWVFGGVTPRCMSKAFISFSTHCWA